MSQFRKKPVVVDAVQFNPTDTYGVLSFLQDCPGWRIEGLDIVIPTLEGNHRASPGDWIIRGIKGEYYPCKPDIFAATYEGVGERPAPVKPAWSACNYLSNSGTMHPGAKPPCNGNRCALCSHA